MRLLTYTYYKKKNMTDKTNILINYEQLPIQFI